METPTQENVPKREIEMPPVKIETAEPTPEGQEGKVIFDAMEGEVREFGKQSAAEAAKFGENPISDEALELADISEVTESKAVTARAAELPSQEEAALAPLVAEARRTVEDPEAKGELPEVADLIAKSAEVGERIGQEMGVEAAKRRLEEIDGIFESGIKGLSKEQIDELAAETGRLEKIVQASEPVVSRFTPEQHRLLKAEGERLRKEFEAQKEELTREWYRQQKEFNLARKDTEEGKEVMFQAKAAQAGIEKNIQDAEAKMRSAIEAFRESLVSEKAGPTKGDAEDAEAAASGAPTPERAASIPDQRAAIDALEEAWDRIGDQLPEQPTAETATQEAGPVRQPEQDAAVRESGAREIDLGETPTEELELAEPYQPDETVSLEDWRAQDEAKKMYGFAETAPEKPAEAKTGEISTAAEIATLEKAGADLMEQAKQAEKPAEEASKKRKRVEAWSSPPDTSLSLPTHELRKEEKKKREPLTAKLSRWGGKISTAISKFYGFLGLK